MKPRTQRPFHDGLCVWGSRQFVLANRDPADGIAKLEPGPLAVATSVGQSRGFSGLLGDRILSPEGGGWNLTTERGDYGVLSNPQAAGGSRAMRILIIEDNPKIAASVRRGLGQHGFAVDVCHTGFDAQSDYLIKRTAAETAGPTVDLARAVWDRSRNLYEDVRMPMENHTPILAGGLL